MACSASRHLCRTFSVDPSNIFQDFETLEEVFLFLCPFSNLSMDRNDRYRITSNFSELVYYTKDFVHKVSDDFITRGILSPQHNQKINEEKTDERKSRALLEMIRTPGKLLNEHLIYEVFCETVDKEGCEPVKEILQRTVIPEDMDIDEPICDEKGDYSGKVQQQDFQASGDNLDRGPSNTININHSSGIHIGPKTTYNIQK